MLFHMLKKSIFIILVFSLLPTLSSASIQCPVDITINCTMNYGDLNMTGHAYATYGVARYFDQTNLNFCHVGTVYRTWYADKNWNYQLDEYEVSCVQKITITDIVVQNEVFFPEDRLYDCVDDIVDEHPTFYGGPCDNFGVNVDDQVFNVVSGVCYKILRHFTVINWCDYKPNDPYWNGGGIWTHTQEIKVIDQTAPQFGVKGDFVFGVDATCTASVQLKNVAVDHGYCPSPTLKYELYLDLNSDQVFEERYSFLLSGKRNIPI